MAHTILMVDDEASIREAMRRALRREPYRFLEADSGERALELLRTEAVDVIVSDQLMPGLTGLELCARIREEHPATIRILLTGEGDMRLIRQAIGDETLYCFVRKPWDLDDLSLLLQRAARHLDLMREGERLLRLVQAQRRIIAELEGRSP